MAGYPWKPRNFLLKMMLPHSQAKQSYVPVLSPAERIPSLMTEGRPKCKPTGAQRVVVLYARLKSEILSGLFSYEMSFQKGTIIGGAQRYSNPPCSYATVMVSGLCNEIQEIMDILAL